MANWYYPGATAGTATVTVYDHHYQPPPVRAGNTEHTVPASEYVRLPNGKLVRYDEYMAQHAGTRPSETVLCAPCGAQKGERCACSRGMRFETLANGMRVLRTHEEIADMPVKHRTQEEIEAQLLARYRELEAEAAEIKAQEAAERQKLKCLECRWHARGYGEPYCNNALVKGFDERLPPAVDRIEQSSTGGYSLYPKVRLCGPEKALWEPIPPRWERLVEWLGKKFGWDSN